MHIILADPRGFCAGVNMAIETLNRALELYGPPVYVFHEIVHNKHVVDDFRDRGAVFVNEIDEVPEGTNLVFSAHGVSPEVRRMAADRDLRVVDATCPLVMKVHSEAIRFARQGHTILLIGHEGHDEVAGTMGEAPERIQLVQSAADVDSLELSPDTRLAYLSQTTLSVDDVNRLVGRIRERFPTVAAPPSDDICYATQNRQDGVRQLAGEVDVVLVVGSQNSSNSQRLAEIARESGVRAYLIDRASEIDERWLAGAERVAITAGASAPEALVTECIDRLRDRFGATVEERQFHSEDLRFQLPASIRPRSRAATR